MKAFWTALERFGDAPCVMGEQCLSYQEVARLSDRFFEHRSDPILDQAARPVALIFCGRDVATLLCYLGCLRAGVIPLLLSEDMTDASASVYVERYQPRYIWRKDKADGEGPCDDATPRHTLGAYTFWDRGAIDVPSNPHLALLLTTSGSTADPKLVRLSYDNLQANADAIADHLALDPASRPITLLPFHYSFGLSVINSHLWVGASIVFTAEGLAAKGFWEAFRGEAVTSFYGVPYHFEILHKFRFQRQDFPALRLLAQAGGRMPVPLQDTFVVLSEQKGYRFVSMYGQTEATARMTILLPEDRQTKSESVGQAIPHGRLSIIDPDEHRIGEVCYHGPNVSFGYANTRADLQLGDVNQGTLLTGDLGYIDDDGFLFLCGRKKRYVKVYGHNVNLDHVEALLTELSMEVAVIGEDNNVTVLLVNGNAQDVKTMLLQKTTIQPSALVIKEVDTLAHKPSGKMDYAGLNERYLRHA